MIIYFLYYIVLNCIFVLLCKALLNIYSVIWKALYKLIIIIIIIIITNEQLINGIHLNGIIINWLNLPTSLYQR